jgi:hypothetical protein
MQTPVSLTCSGESAHVHVNDLASAGEHGYALLRQVVARQANACEFPPDDEDDHALATGSRVDNWLLAGFPHDASGRERYHNSFYSWQRAPLHPN